MKKIFNFTFVLAMILGSASCSDDDVNNLNEWSAIYVGIERPSLSVSEESFTLKHSAAEGIETFSFPVTVKLSRMAT